MGEQVIDPDHREILEQAAKDAGNFSPVHRRARLSAEFCGDELNVNLTWLGHSPRGEQPAWDKAAIEAADAVARAYGLSQVHTASAREGMIGQRRYCVPRTGWVPL